MFSWKFKKNLAKHFSRNDLRGFRMFFLLCDGIFLNYCWKEEHLQRSVETVSKIRNKTKSQIYVGIDVFGRGCFGGGHFDCNIATKMINKYELSTALFAPAWTYQNLGCENFEANDFKWVRIGMVPASPITICVLVEEKFSSAFKLKFSGFLRKIDISHFL